MTADIHSSRNTLTGPRLAIYIGVLAMLAIAVMLVCSMIGVVDTGWDIWKIRMMRLLKAATVGAALAAAGVALQGMLRNPLAEPYILGISSGAGVGVLLGMAFVTTSTWATMPALAFAGALATCVVVYFIAQRRGRLDPYTLLLSGVIVNAFNGAVMLAIFLFIPPRTITNFTYWGMGQINDRFEWALFAITGSCVVLGWGLLVLRGAAFNTLGLGDDVANSTGVSVGWLRVETFVIVSLMTAAAVALAGPIGFVGLIIPHVCRLIVGPDHRLLTIVSGFVGAMFLMAADTLCRSVPIEFRTGSIPVGIVTAFCGGPFFIYLLRQRFREPS